MNTVLFRWHKGTLDESMKTIQQVVSFEHLKSIIFGPETLYSPGELTIFSYGFDERIDWNTQAVCLNGSIVGFLSALLTED